MRLKIVGMMVAATAGAAYFGACSVPQPSAGCPRATTPYVFAYTLKDGTGVCAEKTHELVGIEKYNPPGTQEYSVAITPEGLGNEQGSRPDEDPSRKPYAIGTLSALPDDNGFCTVALATTAQVFPATPAGTLEDGGVDPETPAQAERAIAYEWTNMKLLASANVPGTILESDLKYTEDGCTANYSVVGLWPPIGCIAGEDEVTGDPIFDDGLCDPLPNLDAGHPLGSGINPSLPVKCDRETGYCLLTKTPTELAPTLK